MESESSEATVSSPDMSTDDQTSESQNKSSSRGPFEVKSTKSKVFKIGLVILLVGFLFFVSGIYVGNIYRFSPPTESPPTEPLPIETSPTETGQRKPGVTPVGEIPAREDTDKTDELDVLISEIAKKLSKNDMLGVFNMQTPEKVTCGESVPYIDSSLCEGVTDGMVVDGYSMSRYLSEGVITGREVVKEAFQKYSEHGPFTYVNRDVRMDAHPSNGYAEAYFVDRNKELVLTLVFRTNLEKEPWEWEYVNFFYGMPYAEVLEKFNQNNPN